MVHPIDIALNTFVHIDSLDPSYSADASYDGAVGGGTYPPNFWKAGEVVVDRYKFHLSANQELDNINMTPLAVHVGMYEAPPTGGILHVKTEPPDATDVGAEITHWKIRPSRLSQNPVWLGS